MNKAEFASWDMLWFCCGLLAIELLWEVLEMALYGEVQPRKVDAIISLIWSASVVMAYKRGLKYGKEAAHGA